MYIFIAILAFGLLIAMHEGGHFTAAKLLGVRVNEFSIGMGPQIFSKQKGETTYSLRLLPIGGYCAMEGEDEESEDPRAFTSAPRWKRFLILCAGSFTNFLFGLLVALLLFWPSQYFVLPIVDSVVDGFLYGGEEGILPGDEIYSINGHRIYYSGDFTTFMSLSNGSVDMVVKRNGERILLKNYGLRPESYVENGQETYRYGVNFTLTEADTLGRIKYGLYEGVNFARLVFVSLEQLFTGRAGVNDMMGAVGIVETINEVGQNSPTFGIAMENIAYLIAFIAVNLAVMNMLPIPALDGGRVFALFATWIIESITHKKLDPKYEGYVHAAGMVLLLGLMAFIVVNDVLRIVRG